MLFHSRKTVERKQMAKENVQSSEKTFIHKKASLNFVGETWWNLFMDVFGTERAVFFAEDF